jgi:hypothetical protein
MLKVKPFVAAIVLNWNGLKDTHECLKSLQGISYQNYRIVLVDNASTDGSVKILRKAYPDLTIIENEENLGFSEGNNVGIRYALSQGADYIWILNNDTVVDPLALTALIDVAGENTKIGILGSKIYYYDEPDTLWFAGGPMDWHNLETPHVGINEKDYGQYDEIKEYDRVAGCSMMVTRELCDQIGLMDPAYFLYVEEIDWCLRAWANGFKVVYVPGSKVYHKVSKAVQLLQSREKVFSYYKNRNFLYLLKKIYKAPISYLMMCRYIIKVIKRERSKGNSLRPILFALYDFIFGHMGELSRTF